MTTGWAEAMLTVTDVKNYFYCRRVVFYRAFLTKRPTTFKMEHGKEFHERVAELEERRSLRAYGLSEGEREHHVRLRSTALGLSGLLDMAILAGDETMPVEFKYTSGRPAMNHKYQLAAYALLGEERWGRPVRRGFIYVIPAKRAEAVVITDEMRQAVRAALQEMRAMLASEIKPAPTNSRERCVDCEFRRYCLDIG